MEAINYTEAIKTPFAQCRRLPVIITLQDGKMLLGETTALAKDQEGFVVTLRDRYEIDFCGTKLSVGSLEVPSHALRFLEGLPHLGYLLEDRLLRNGYSQDVAWTLGRSFRNFAPEVRKERDVPRVARLIVEDCQAKLQGLSTEKVRTIRRILRGHLDKHYKDARAYKKAAKARC